MEPTESDDHHHRPPPPMPPSQLMQSLLPRDSRGSLEVFNPSGYSSSSSSSSFRSTHPNLKTPQFLPDPPRAADKVATWMALKKTSDPAEVSAASQRAAEWGLVLKTDAGTGKPQGVIARTSGDDEPGKAAAARVRPSGGSLRSSGESSDDCGAAGGRDRGVPRVSEDLKDALSAFQQTFVVSDGTRSDYPILYASEGFFKMTGYTSKEVIGRNCRFLQGPDTDPEDAAKIREALHAGTSYCGRLLNYKKDGTPFWNLLTIAPIKDDNGNVIKFIGMQVEVSKHTEGSKDKMVRPNGLPQSFIRYDARQKEDATSSVSELMMAFKRPRALSESYNRGRPLTKSDGGGAPERLETSRRRNSEATAAPPRRKSRSGTTAATMQPIHELPQKKQKKSDRRSFNPLSKKSSEAQPKTDFETSDSGAILDGDGDGDGEGDGDDCGDDDVASDNEWLESVEDGVRKKDMRKGLDLATTLERIEKNFVITDPRLPDNPIIFASDSFLELTEYSREEILGTNCRFLQGPETDRATVRKIREAVDNETDVTVQLINYTKTGKKFWNIFHLQPMRDQKGKVQYFIGVQLDGTQHIEPHHSSVPEATANESAKLVKQTAENVDEAVRELPDANTKPEDLWTNHSKMVLPKPHKRDSPSWKAIQKILDGGEQIGLKHFRPVRPLGSGDTGSVHLVELSGTGEYFAMKAMDKNIMLNRNKVHRACAEREILDMLDHPFLPALYASFQTKTHICLITDFYPGGELFVLLDRQPKKVLREDAVKFYAAEVVIALEYLHCQGIIYRDLKPENILLQRSGHVSLTDFDLSCLTSCKPQLLIMKENQKKKSKKGRQPPLFLAEPMRASNSFVGTEEYIAPEIVKGAGHTSAVDWWALGILIYEMLYGYTPFRGKTRQRTFANILHKDLKFPGSIPVSLQAKQLMFGLLHKDPKQRLGSREGANEIKQHQFFRGVSWALVRCMDPPQLDGPLVMTTEATPEVEVDPELIDLQANVF